MDILMSLYNRVGRGTYWRAFNLARNLVKFGHSVTLLSMSEKQLIRFKARIDEGVHILESPDLLPGILRSGWDFWDVIRRIQKIDHLHFDLVHTFECRPVTLYPVLYMHRKYHLPLVTDWGDWFGRGGSVEERRNPILRFVLRPLETYYEENFRISAQGTTVINTVLWEKAADLGVPTQSILLLRNGSDADRIKPVVKKQARMHMKYPLDVPIIGYIGSIFNRDAQLMADAFKYIKEALPQAILLVAGHFDADLEKMTGYPESIIRTGPVRLNQIGIILSTCDVCWLPMCDSGANRGRWPIKMNVYMAVGRPVVTTAIGDLGTFIEQYQFGLASRDTPQNLGEAVVNLITNPEKCRNLGLRARKLAETTFSWETISKQLETFYTRIIARGT